MQRSVGRMFYAFAFFSCPPNCEPGSLSRHKHTYCTYWFYSNTARNTFHLNSVLALNTTLLSPPCNISIPFIPPLPISLSSLIAHLRPSHTAHRPITLCLSPTCSLPSVYPSPSTFILPRFLIPLISLSVTHHVLHSLMYCF